MTKSQRARAKNEVAFRRANNEKSRLAKEILDIDASSELELNFDCECSDPLCLKPIALTLSNYERLRRHDRQFIVLAGHEQTDIEHVVETGEYVVVEKEPGLIA